MTRVRIHTPVSQAVAAGAWVVAALAALGGTSEAGSSGSVVVGATVVTACVAFALRSLVLGVVIQGNRVVVRSWLRTRTLPAASLRRVDPVGYDGLWVRGSESRVLRTLRLTTDTGEVTAWGVLGRHAVVDRCARQVRQHAGLPARRAAGQHRRPDRD